MSANKKKILVFSHDPGGAKVVTACLDELSNNFIIELYGKSFALKIYQQQGLKATDIDTELTSFNEPAISKFLLNKAFDFIVTSTSAADFTERFIWQAAKKNNIPCIAILDQWMNYSARFLALEETTSFRPPIIQTNKAHIILPDAIMVMDHHAKESMCLEGFPAEKIIITGQPYFEQFNLQHKQNSNKVYTSEVPIKYQLSQYSKVWLFASEPITTIYGDQQGKAIYGYTELINLTAICNFIQNSEQGKIKLLIKPHPKEESSNFNQLCHRFDFISVVDEKSSIDLINHSDAVLGMSSSVLLEAAILGKAILSVQLNLAMADPFVLSQIGKSKSVVNENVLTLRLTELIADELPFKANIFSENFLQENKKACNNISHYMLRQLNY